MNRAALLFCLACSVPSTAVAEVPLKLYDQYKNEAGFKAYIGGVGIGFAQANIALATEGRTLLYCQPETLALPASGYLDILDQQVKAARGKVSEDTSVEVLLFLGLRQKFPCRQ